ncbi:MAG: porin family protein [Prevotella sp.]|nr:porin family protein [Prevotella sp.]
MKKIMMTLVAVAMATTMNAQAYIGGGIGFQTTSQGDVTNTVIKLIPEVGYNLDANWAVGIALGYGHTKNSVEVNGVETSVKADVFAISPYARYTFAKFDKVNLFVDGGLSYTHTKAGNDKNNTFAIGFKPGVAVNLNDKLSFVAHVGFLGYQNSKDDYDGAEAANTFGLDLDGSSLTFGLYYNF